MIMRVLFTNSVIKLHVKLRHKEKRIACHYPRSTVCCYRRIKNYKKFYNVFFSKLVSFFFLQDVIKGSKKNLNLGIFDSHSKISKNCRKMTRKTKETSKTEFKKLSYFFEF